MPNSEANNPTIELLKQRASCRNFSDRRVSDAVLNEILEAGVHGPTGGNLQPYSIIAVRKAATRRRLCELCGEQSFIAKAPVNLLFCIDWHRLDRWAEMEAAPFTASDSFRMFWISMQDTVICAQNIVTAADSLGLGSVYVGLVLECFLDLRDMFALPNGVLPVVLLCLGYPGGEMKPAARLGPDVVVHHESYEERDDAALRKAFREKHAGKTREITDDRMVQIAEVCRAVHGEEFAERCIGRIVEEGHINAAQSYFGLQYPSDRMAEDNDIFIDEMEALGFGWFKKFVPRPRP